MSKLTLISFAACPYVQRAVIALKEKRVDFEIIYIDLDNKPEWFLKISPLGKVPVLKVAREGKPEAVIFESAVILEYLEETAGGTALHPADPVERALHRAWMEFGSTVTTDFAKLTWEPDAAKLDGMREALRAKLARLEGEVKGPYFAGEGFSNVDAVFAPVFMRMAALENKAGGDVCRGLPKVAAWKAALLARPSVRDSVVADFEAQFFARLEGKGSAALRVGL